MLCIHITYTHTHTLLLQFYIFVEDFSFLPYIKKTFNHFCCVVVCTSTFDCALENRDTSLFYSINFYTYYILCIHGHSEMKCTRYYWIIATDSLINLNCFKVANDWLCLVVLVVFLNKLEITKFLFFGH